MPQVFVDVETVELRDMDSKPTARDHQESTSSLHHHPNSDTYKSSFVDIVWPDYSFIWDIDVE
jgi:hypothetical protein